MNPTISAVICTHSRASYLKKALASLVAQSLPQDQFEIIVVDNCSTDNTKDMALDYAAMRPVRYVYEPELGLSHARNTGWRNARGRYVAYLDDDAIACREWLEKIVEVFETVTPQPGCVGGKAVAIWEGARPQWLSDHLLHGLTIIDWGGPHVVSDFYREWLVGANFALPRNVLSGLGGFTDRLDRQGMKMLSSGDVFLQKQVVKSGMNCFYHPAIAVEHHIFSSRLSQTWFRQRYYWQGVSDSVMILLEDSPTKRTLLRLVWSRIKKLTASPQKLVDAVFSQDPERFTEACFALITLGQIRGLLAALRR